MYEEFDRVLLVAEAQQRAQGETQHNPQTTTARVASLLLLCRSGTLTAPQCRARAGPQHQALLEALARLDPFLHCQFHPTVNNNSHNNSPTSRVDDPRTPPRRPLPLPPTALSVFDRTLKAHHENDLSTIIDLSPRLSAEEWTAVARQRHAECLVDPNALVFALNAFVEENAQDFVDQVAPLVLTAPLDALRRLVQAAGEHPTHACAVVTLLNRHGGLARLPVEGGEQHTGWFLTEHVVGQLLDSWDDEQRSLHLLSLLRLLHEHHHIDAERIFLDCVASVVSGALDSLADVESVYEAPLRTALGCASVLFQLPQLDTTSKPPVLTPTPLPWLPTNPHIAQFLVDTARLISRLSPFAVSDALIDTADALLNHLQQQLSLLLLEPHSFSLLSVVPPIDSCERSVTIRLSILYSPSDSLLRSDSLSPSHFLRLTSLSDHFNNTSLFVDPTAIPEFSRSNLTRALAETLPTLTPTQWTRITLSVLPFFSTHSHYSIPLLSTSTHSLFEHNCYLVTAHLLLRVLLALQLDETSESITVAYCIQRFVPTFEALLKKSAELEERLTIESLSIMFQSICTLLGLIELSDDLFVAALALTGLIRTQAEVRSDSQWSETLRGFVQCVRNPLHKTALERKLSSM